MPQMPWMPRCECGNPMWSDREKCTDCSLEIKRLKAINSMTWQQLWKSAVPTCGDARYHNGVDSWIFPKGAVLPKYLEHYRKKQRVVMYEDK